MKNIQFLIFLVIVLTIYSLTNFYIFSKGYHAITPTRENKILYTTVFIILAATFVLGKIFEVRHSSVFSDILNIIGGFWLGFMLYGFLFLLVTDITGLVLRITGIITPDNVFVYRKWSFIGTVIISFLLITGGFINAVIPVVRKFSITVNKSAGETRSLRIAAVSDIHLGSIIRKRSIKKLSLILKDLKPDVVFLLGDIVDGELGPVMRGDLLRYFTIPETADGLYAITGNHEFIGGASRTIPYIESKGIRLLKDETVTLPGGIQVVGRLDRDSKRFFSKERMPVEELAKQVDTSRPVILLDHQPLNLGEAVKLGADLQLSGHTHNGQIWPLNYVVRWIYELAYGYLQKGDTHYIVSSGYGLWGPRIRSGSRSEVLQIDLVFTGGRISPQSK